MKILILALAVITQTPTVDRIDTITECRSQDKIRIETDAIQYRPNSGEDALIPVYIHVPEALLSCAKYLIIRSEMGPIWQLRSHYNSIEMEPVNARREPLYLTPSARAWWVPLERMGGQTTIYLKALNASDAAPGDYTGILEYALTADLVGDENLPFLAWQVGFNVQRRISISFGGAADFSAQPSRSYYELDLGNLATGNTYPIETYFTGNTRFTLRIESENQGQLMHRQSDYAIAYDLTSQQGAIDLRGVSSLLLGVDGTMRTSHFPMQLTVPNVSQFAPAGDYYDIISFEVTPND